MDHNLGFRFGPPTLFFFKRNFINKRKNSKLPPQKKTLGFLALDWAYTVISLRRQLRRWGKDYAHAWGLWNIVIITARIEESGRHASIGLINQW